MSDEQSALYPPNDPETPAEVYIVASNYPDDPHPHIEGVFEDPSKAGELMDDCKARTKSPHPTAWTLYRAEVGGELEVIDP